MTVEELKESLENLPDNARVYAYEGEDIGIVVRATGETGKQHPTEIAFIKTESA